MPPALGNVVGFNGFVQAALFKQSGGELKAVARRLEKCRNHVVQRS
jgi:hypothetical protein